MHFAICVWGIVRSLQYTIDSIHNYCLDPIVNAGHTYEIYMHTYQFAGVYDNLRNNELGVKFNFSEWKNLRPDHIFVEDQDLFDASANYDAYHTLGDPWKNDYQSFKNHLRAMNSLHYLATQVEKDSKHIHFDGVVYLRPDVTYLNELPFHLIEHLPNTLFVPDFHRSCRGGQYNDRMAMGDLQTGLIYGKKYEAALSYAQRKPLHSESFVYDYLHMKNVTVLEVPFRFRRTRAKGEYHVRDGTAIMAPWEQKPVPEYTTFCALRWIYTLLEMATGHTVYVWNHDDYENLYCKPNAYLTLEQVINYRKLSTRKRAEANKLLKLQTRYQEKTIQKISRYDSGDDRQLPRNSQSNQNSLNNNDNNMRQVSSERRDSANRAHNIAPLVDSAPSEAEQQRKAEGRMRDLGADSSGSSTHSSGVYTIHSSDLDAHSSGAKLNPQQPPQLKHMPSSGETTSFSVPEGAARKPRRSRDRTATHNNNKGRKRRGGVKKGSISTSFDAVSEMFAHQPAHPSRAVQEEEQLLAKNLPRVNQGLHNLRGMFSRELEEEQARLKKSRNLRKEPLNKVAK